MVKKNIIIIAASIIATVLIVLGIYTATANNSNNCITFNSAESCDTDFIGLSVDEAIDKADKKGLTSRVVIDNNNPNIIINDNRLSGRVNFTVENNAVIAAEFY